MVKRIAASLLCLVLIVVGIIGLGHMTMWPLQGSMLSMLCRKTLWMSSCTVPAMHGVT